MVEHEAPAPLLGKKCAFIDLICGFSFDIPAQLDVVKQRLILVSHNNMRSEKLLGGLTICFVRFLFYFMAF